MHEYMDMRGHVCMYGHASLSIHTCPCIPIYSCMSMHECMDIHVTTLTQSYKKDNEKRSLMVPIRNIIIQT